MVTLLRVLGDVYRSLRYLKYDVPNRDQDMDKVAIASALESTLSNHPLYVEARAKFHCAGPELMLFSREDVNRTKLVDAVKTTILAQMGATDSNVRILVFFTSDVTPEPLAGYGKLYAFIFHPKYDKLLHADVSTWRS